MAVRTPYKSLEGDGGSKSHSSVIENLRLVQKYGLTANVSEPLGMLVSWREIQAMRSTPDRGMVTTVEYGRIGLECRSALSCDVV